MSIDTTGKERSFYCYVIKRKGLPVYVGAGSGNRIATSRLERARALDVRPGTLAVDIVREGLTKAEAHTAEVDLIAQLGRQVDGGQLLNRARGGPGTPGVQRGGGGESRAIDRRIVQLTLDGKIQAQIGADLGITQQAVSRRLKKIGRASETKVVKRRSPFV